MATPESGDGSDDLTAPVAPTPGRGAPPRWWRVGLVVVGLAALVLRVGYVAVAKADEPVLGDQIYYNAQANVLADGAGFTDPFRPERQAADHAPLTALVLAPVSAATGDSLMAHRYAMAVVGTLAVLAVALLGRAVAGPRTGLVAGALAAVYPNLWMNDGLVMSESPATLFVALTLLAAYRFLDHPSRGGAAWMGLWLGLATLARAEIVLLWALLVVPVVFAGWRARRRARRAHGASVPTPVGGVAPPDDGPPLGGAADGAPGLGVAGATPAPGGSPGRERWIRLGVATAVLVAVIAPWTLANLARFERPVVFSTQDGLTLLGANCASVYYETSIGLWDLRCATDLAPAPETLGDQSEVSAFYRDAAVAFVRDNLGRVPAVVAVRVLRVWSLYAPDQMVWYNQGEGREAWASWAGLWMYYALAVAAVVGVVVLARRRIPWWPLVSTVVLVTLTAALFYGLVRFRVPAEVSLVVLAAVAVDAGLARLGAGGGSGGSPAAAGAPADRATGDDSPHLAGPGSGGESEASSAAGGGGSAAPGTVPT